MLLALQDPASVKDGLTAADERRAQGGTRQGLLEGETWLQNASLQDQR